MATPFRFDGTFQFPVTPDRFWETISRTEDFPKWWGWLGAFDCNGLHEGAEARFDIRSPLPFPVRFRVTVDRLVPGRLVETTVQGDFLGPARLEVAPDGSGCSVRLSWTLEAGRPLLRVAGRIARPLLTWGQHQVIDMGMRQFRRRALGS